MASLFFVIATLLIIGVIYDFVFTYRSIGYAFDSIPRYIGYVTGTMIPILLYVFTGIFLFNFDRAYKRNYVEEFYT